MKHKEHKKTQPKTKVNNFQRDWYLFDVADKKMGRVCTVIAKYLRGKNKPSFNYSKDLGNYCVIINASKIKFTGNKLENKKYFSHSGYPGGIKSKSLKEMLAEKPEQLFKKAIGKMIPQNKLSKIQIKRLKVFTNESHSHQAQKPKVIELGE